MTVKSAVYDAAMFLELEDVCRALEAGGEGEGETADEIKLLVRLANLVVQEIASEYIPLKTKENVTALGCEVPYSALKKEFSALYAVRRLPGRAVVPVRRYHDFFAVPKDGDYEVEYGFLPDTLTLADPLPFGGEITDRVAGYGIACEYCIISGRTDEAVTWDKRYKDALHFATSEKRPRRVAARRWL